MKRFFSYVSIFLLSGMLITTTGQGRGRQNYNRPSSTTQSTPNRPSAPSSRPGNSGNNRPGNRPDNRPDNRPGNRPGNRPDNRPGNNHRPDNRPNHRPDNRPDNRPGNNHRPDYRPDHGYRPGPGYRPGRPMPPAPPAVRPHPRPPYRPYAPAYRPWSRPVPPPAFRPYRGCPVISTIFGITLGATLDYSLNYLLNGGYTVAGYGNDVIYLNNVNQYNYMWPQATMHYVNGNLSGTELVFSSAAYDMSRYNLLYNSFVNQYGYPVSTQNNNGGVSATWWGYNNGYITLSFFGDYANNGAYRYYTTVSYGN